MWLFKKLFEQNVTQSVAFSWLCLQVPETGEKTRVTPCTRKETRFLEASACWRRGAEESREPLTTDLVGWVLLVAPSAHQQLPLPPRSQASELPATSVWNFSCRNTPVASPCPRGAHGGCQWVLTRHRNSCRPPHVFARRLRGRPLLFVRKGGAWGGLGRPTHALC